MRNFLISLLLMLISFSGMTQAAPPDLKNTLRTSIGKSNHGSGDLNGVVFSTEYTRRLKKKLSWGLIGSGTIHDGSLPLIFTSGGNEIDGSVRYTIGGLQLGGIIAYSVLHSTHHELEIKSGLFARYQSSSYPDDFTILYPSLTGLPTPVVVFNNSTPQRSYTVGIDVKLNYFFSLNNRNTIGVGIGIQLDSAGDSISQIGLIYGIKF